MQPTPACAETPGLLEGRCFAKRFKKRTNAGQVQVQDIDKLRKAVLRPPSLIQQRPQERVICRLEINEHKDARYHAFKKNVNKRLDSMGSKITPATRPAPELSG